MTGLQHYGGPMCPDLGPQGVQRSMSKEPGGKNWHAACLQHLLATE